MKQPCPDCEVIQREVPHIANTYQIEAALVRSKNVVTSRPEEGDLLDLGPIFQVPEPMALAEVSDQVYESVLHKEVRHFQAPPTPCLVEVHVQVSKENGVLEKFKGLLQVR